MLLIVPVTHHPPGVSFLRFPKDGDLAKRRDVAMRRENFKPIFAARAMFAHGAAFMIQRDLRAEF